MGSIRERREALALTQLQLADAVGCSRSLIALLDKGLRTSPRFRARVEGTLERLEAEPAPEVSVPLPEGASAKLQRYEWERLAERQALLAERRAKAGLSGLYGKIRKL